LVKKSDRLYLTPLDGKWVMSFDRLTERSTCGLFIPIHGTIFRLGDQDIVLSEKMCKHLQPFVSMLIPDHIKSVDGGKNHVTHILKGNGKRFCRTASTGKMASCKAICMRCQYEYWKSFSKRPEGIKSVRKLVCKYKLLHGPNSVIYKTLNIIENMIG